MTDHENLIKRLRDPDDYRGWNVRQEAADALARLVEERDELKAEVAQLEIDHTPIGLQEAIERRAERTEADLAAARKALIKAQEEIVHSAYSVGFVKDGEYDHCCMSEAEWLVRECGMSGRNVPLKALHDAMEVLPEKLADAAIAAARAEGGG